MKVLGKFVFVLYMAVIGYYSVLIPLYKILHGQRFIPISSNSEFGTVTVNSKKYNTLYRREEYCISATTDTISDFLFLSNGVEDECVAGFSLKLILCLGIIVAAVLFNPETFADPQYNVLYKLFGILIASLVVSTVIKHAVSTRWVLESNRGLSGFGYAHDHGFDELTQPLIVPIFAVILLFFYRNRIRRRRTLPSN